MSMNEKILELTKLLSEKGVDASKLAVLGYGQEQVFGEAEDSGNDGLFFRVKNPKRFLRLQRVDAGSFRVDFILVDFDIVSEGTISVFPQVILKLADCDDETRARYMSIYLNYFEQKKMAAAKAAGIVAPEPNEMPSNLRSLIK